MNILIFYGVVAAVGHPDGAYLDSAVVEHVQVPKSDLVHVTVLAVEFFNTAAALPANVPAIVPVEVNAAVFVIADVTAVPAVEVAGALRLRILEPVHPKSHAPIAVFPSFKQVS